MSEERLQEIKDSVDFQYTLAKAKCIDNALLFADEEKELIEEIERLNNIIKEVREYIEKNIEYTEQKLDFDNMKTYNCALIELQKILDKVGDEK